MSFRPIGLVAAFAAAIAVAAAIYVLQQPDESAYTVDLQLMGEFSGSGAFSFSDDGEKIFATTEPPGSNTPNIVAIWDAKSQAKLGELVCDNLERLHTPHQTSPVTAIATSPDGKIIAIAGPCGNIPGMEYWGLTSIQLWDIESRTLIKTIRTSSYAHYLKLLFSPDGQVIYASGTGGPTVTSTLAIVDVWNVEQSRLLTTLETGTSGIVTGTSISGNGELIAVAVESVDEVDNGRVMLWRTNSYEPLELDLTGVRQIEFHPDNMRLIAGKIDSSIHLVDISSSDIIRQMFAPLKCEHNRIDGLAISPDGRLIVGTGYNMPAIFWRVHDGTALKSLPTECDDVDFDPVWGKMAFNSSGSLFAMHSGTKISVWKMERV
ncbi:WD40 repeat domain-containing protein [Nocardia sp. NPDC003979]